MPFDYEYREAAATKPDGDTQRTDGYVVFNTDTQEEFAVYGSKEDAERACTDLNLKEGAGEL